MAALLLPPVSVIVTVKNEAGSIAGLLDSLAAQTTAPDEVVVVDGGSNDGTVEVVERYRQQGFPITLIVRPGCNISEGRNAAIAAAANEVIAATDAGVRLAPDWLERLIEPFATGNPADGPDVVSGFFVADARSTFEKAMGATVLPSLADVDPRRFLPSSRSVAFTRTAWRAAGGYPEWLDYCEDLVFDLALKRMGCRFAFAPGAVAYFRPRSNLRSFFLQYYRYARGDGKADLWRRRHAIRYATYTMGPLALVLGFWYKGVWLPLGFAAGLYLYAPFRRLRGMTTGSGIQEVLPAALLVPLIRLVGDVAKMIGYPAGVWWRRRHRAAMERREGGQFVD